MATRDRVVAPGAVVRPVEVIGEYAAGIHIRKADEFSGSGHCRVVLERHGDGGGRSRLIHGDGLGQRPDPIARSASDLTDVALTASVCGGCQLPLSPESA